MVNYNVLTIGLEVEFQFSGKVYGGIVRYKGPLNGKDGLWVGVEAKQPVGFCDGRLDARTYFKCKDKFGLFLTAEELRLATYRRKTKKNKLYKSTDSECDDILFKKAEAADDYKICITEEYLKRARSSFSYGGMDLFQPAVQYPLRETLTYNPKYKSKNEDKSDSEENTETSSFHPSASVSKTFMPTDELKLYTKLAWSYKNKNLNLPRDTSGIKDTFDSFNQSRSNYIEPKF